MKLSIILPCYNEALSLKKIVDKSLKIIANDVEIIFVDNGSTDNTYEILSQMRLPKNFKIVRVIKNIGYGNGILKGLAHSSGEIIAWTHADLQTDISDVIFGYDMYKEELLNKTCMVKGERKKRNLFDFIFTFLMGVYCSIFFKKWFYDINAQPKIFHRSFLKKFNNPPLDFSLDLFLIHYFKFENLNVKTFPVFFSEREYGLAKGGGTLKGKIKLISRTLSYIHELKRKYHN